MPTTTHSFANIVAAVQAVVLEGTTGVSKDIVLHRALAEYVGVRPERTGDEQALFIAAESYINALSKGKSGRKIDEAFERLVEEFGYYCASTGVMAPLENPVDFPTLTVEELAAAGLDEEQAYANREHPSPIMTQEVLDAIRAEIRDAVSGAGQGPLLGELLDVSERVIADRPMANVVDLKAAYMEALGRDDLEEKDKDFLSAVATFIREERSARTFGDNPAPAQCKLEQAIETYRDPLGVDAAQGAEPKPFDPLADLLYVEAVISPELDFVDHYKVQIFSGGRPVQAGAIVKASKEARPGKPGPKDVAEFEKVAVARSLTIVYRAIPKPYLYILMRTDLGSMNAGKAVAQGTHAALQMMYEAAIHTDPIGQILNEGGAKNLTHMIKVYCAEANGFGTCITLGCNEQQMRESVASAKEAGLHAGITHDPSYPVRDGTAFYTVPLDTCAYIFDYPSLIKPHVAELSLMP